MANASTYGDPKRNIRVADQLWTQARQVAESRGDSVAEVMRTALEEYVHRNRGLKPYRVSVHASATYDVMVQATSSTEAEEIVEAGLVLEIGPWLLYNTRLKAREEK